MVGDCIITGIMSVLHLNIFWRKEHNFAFYFLLPWFRNNSSQSSSNAIFFFFGFLCHVLEIRGFRRSHVVFFNKTIHRIQEILMLQKMGAFFAKLVNRISIAMVYYIYINIVFMDIHGVYKPTYIFRVPRCRYRDLWANHL